MSRLKGLLAPAAAILSSAALIVSAVALSSSPTSVPAGIHPIPGPSVNLFTGRSTTVVSKVQATAPAAPLANPVLGVFGGSADPQAVQAFTTTLGGQPKYAMDFLDGSTWASITQTGYPYTSWQGKGYSMIWGVDMLPNAYSANSNPATVNGSCYGLTQEAAGDFNSDFVTVAKNMVAAGFGSSIIRLGWEFNGGWFPWSANGCASAFITAFQQIVTSMRSVTGQSFTFEWNPTRGDQGVGNLGNYYPGNAYVNYVGLDVYDVEWATYPGQPTEFSKMETQSYGLNWLASFSAANNKPMVFPEWGLGWGTCSASGQAVSASNTQVCGGDDATFINDMASWFSSHNVFEANFWDYGTSSMDGANPLTAAALKADFNTGTTTTTTTTTTLAPTTTTTTAPTTTSSTLPVTTTTSTIPPTSTSTTAAPTTTTTVPTVTWTCAGSQQGTGPLTLTCRP